MNELIAIIRREYLTRLRTKSFIYISLLTPFFLSIIFFLPAYLEQHNEDKNKKIGIIDNTNTYKNEFDDFGHSIEILDNTSIDNIKQIISNNKFDGIVYIQSNDSSGAQKVLYFYNKQPSSSLLDQIESSIEQSILKRKLNVYGIEDIFQVMNDVKNSTQIETIKVESGSNDTKIIDNHIRRPLCMILGVTIYLFIYLFSSQVMRGISEEKSSRIVELIITSVSPGKFMAGKIIGIAMLGLTQIFAWIIVSYGVFYFITGDLNASSGRTVDGLDPEQINQLLNNISQIDFTLLISTFIVFFIGGYLLYSSMFAAVGAVMNNNEETQQASTLVTIPLIIAILVLTGTVNNPDSTLSYWFSMIPFTSPIVMMGRITYEIPLYEVLLSLSILLVTTLIIIWISGKIYKTAILNNDKKIKIKDLISWITNTNNKY